MGAALGDRVNPIGSGRASGYQPTAAVPGRATILRPDHVHVVLARCIALHRTRGGLSGAGRRVRVQVVREPEVGIALVVSGEAGEWRRRVVADASIEGLLRCPGEPIVVRVGNPESMERLQHADIATSRVLRQVGGDPSHEDPSSVR